MAETTIGIDLGTTNSVVAAADAGGEPRVLPDEHDEKIHPSVVSFHPNGTVIVGAVAKQRRVIDPTNTVSSIKRLIGRPFTSPEVTAARKRMPFRITEGANEQPVIHTRGGQFAIPELSAIVLDHMRAIAKRAQRTEINRAVITVPANFNEGQRSATATAGAIAGLDVMQVLNEPTAAALAYGHRKRLDRLIAVYDFGGGTFDVSLLSIKDHVYEVIATAGNTFLGGDDIDETLVDYMVELFLRQESVDLRADDLAMQRLRSVAEQIKIQLSRRNRAIVKIDEIAYGPGGRGLDLNMEISREELVARCANVVDQTFPVCDEVLKLGNITRDKITDVVLVGGTTKMPYVRQRATQYFNNQPRVDVNPDEAVALGASLQADIIARSERGERVRSRTGTQDKSTEVTRVDPNVGQRVAKMIKQTELRRAQAPSASVIIDADNVANSEDYTGFEDEYTEGSGIFISVEPGEPDEADEVGDTITRVVDPSVDDITMTEPAGTTTEPSSGFAGPSAATHSRPPTMTETDEGWDAGLMDEASAWPTYPASGEITAAQPPIQALDPTAGIGKPNTLEQFSSAKNGPPAFGRATAKGQPIPVPRPAHLGGLAGRLPGPEDVELDDESIVTRANDRGRAPVQEGKPNTQPLPAQMVGPRSTLPLPQHDAKRTPPPLPPVSSPPYAAARPSAVSSPGKTARPGERTLYDPSVSKAPLVAPSPPAHPPPPTPPLPPVAAPSARTLYEPNASSPYVPPASPPSLGPDPIPMDPRPASPPLPGAPPANQHRQDARSEVSQYGLPELGSQPFSAPQIRDVTSYALGIGTVSGFCESLIERNTPVPHEISRNFSTSKDKQTTVRIKVFQGVSRRLDENVRLGELVLESLPPRPRGQTTIAVTFVLNSSGILDVHAVDTATGYQQQASLKIRGQQSEQEVAASQKRMRDILQ